MPPIPESMEAIVMAEPGGLEHVEARTLPVPSPADDEILIEVATVAVNRQEVNVITGRTPRHGLSFPLVLGLDPAGVVASTGHDVQGFSPGDRVVVKPPISCGDCEPCRAGEDDACERISSVGIHRPGGMAGYVAVPQSNVFAIPDGLGFAEASAVSHSFPVALTLLRRVGAGAADTVLVSGAAGAIGSAAVQLARTLGARVIAAVGSERGAAWLRELPADVAPDLIVDYAAEPEFAALVRELEPAGASVYVETAAAPAVWSEATKALARRARIGVIGSHAGPIVELNANWLFRQRISIIGCSGSSLSAYADALRMAGEGRIQPSIDSVLPMAQALDAYQRLIDHDNRGKIVLRVSDRLG